MVVDFEKLVNFPKDIDKNQPVLIVDHQQDLRMIIAHQLSLLKFRNVLQAPDAVRAFKYVREEKAISLIICSLELPDADGLTFLAEISEDMALNRPPFCLTMFDPNKEKIMLAVERCVDEILVKPFQLSEVMVKVHKGFFSFHNPKNPEKIYQIAKESFRAENYDKAEDLYNSLAKIAPHTARPLVGLARIAEKRGQQDKAFQLLDQAEKNNSFYVHLYEERAQMHLKMHNVDDALNEYRRAIEISPLNPIRYIKAAEVLLHHKRYSEMVEVLEMAIKRDIPAPDLWHYMSLGYYQLKNYRSAIQYTKKALINEPENVVYLNQLALAHKACNEFKEAAALYNTVIKLDAGNIQAQYNKAIMLIEQHKLEEAKKILTRLVKKYPEFAKAQEKLQELGSVQDDEKKAS